MQYLKASIYLHVFQDPSLKFQLGNLFIKNNKLSQNVYNKNILILKYVF